MAINLKDFLEQNLAKSTAATSSSKAAQTTAAATPALGESWLTNLNKKAAEVKKQNAGIYQGNFSPDLPYSADPSYVAPQPLSPNSAASIQNKNMTTPIAPVAKATVGALGWLHENISRPVIQATGESLYNTYNSIKGATQGNGFGTTSNDVLIPDNPITGQIGGRSAKEQLGTSALALSNLVGGSGVAAVKTVGAKAVLREATKNKLKTLGEGVLTGALALGGMAAEEGADNKEIAKDAAIGAIGGGVLALAIIGVKGSLGWLKTGLGSKSIAGLEKDLMAKYEQAGVADEVNAIFAKSKEELSAGGKGATFEEILQKNLDESPMRNEIKAASDEFKVTSKGLTTAQKAERSFVNDYPKQDLKTPNPIRTTYTQRAVLIKEFKDYAKGFASGLKSGAKTAKEDITVSLQTAKNFIKEAIPDQGLTKGEASKLISSLSKATTPKALEEAMQRAINVAEASAHRELYSGLQTTVKEVMASFPKTSASMIQKAVEGKLRNSAVAVAQQERNMLALLGNFLKLEVKDFQAVTQRSVSAFLEKNPVFGSLPKDMIESIMGIGKKTSKEFQASDLAKLQRVVDTLVAQGKERTENRLMTMGKTIKDSVARMKATTGTNADQMGKDVLTSITGEPKFSTFTTQTWFDLMDGGIGSKTLWRKQGTISETLWRPLQERLGRNEIEKAAFKERIGEKVKQLSAKLTPDSYERIFIYAQSLQPKSYKKIVSEVGKDVVDSIKLTDSEMDMYLFMRKEMDEVKPSLDAVYLELHGRPIGTVEDFFPFRRNIDSVDSIAKQLEDSIGGSWKESNTAIYKKSSEFGSLKSRSGNDDAFAKMNLNALDVFTNYMDNAIYFKNVEPAIANMRLHLAEKDFRDMIGTSATKWMDSYITLISKKGMKHWAYAPFDKIAGAIKRNLSIAYLAKISTALKQFGSVVVGTGYINPSRTLEGMSMVLKMTKAEREAVIRESYALTTSMGGDAELADLLDEAIKGKSSGIGAMISGAMNYTGKKLLDNTVRITDGFSRLSIYLGAKQKGLDLFDGDVVRAIDYANDIVNRSQISGHFSQTAGVQNMTTAGNLLFPFQTFALGQWNVIRQDFLGGAARNLREGNFYGAAQNAGIFLAIAMAMMAEETIDYTKQVIKGNPDAEDGLIGHFSKNVIPTMLNVIPYVGGGLSDVTRGYDFAQSFELLGISEVDKVLSGAWDLALASSKKGPMTYKEQEKAKKDALSAIGGAASLAGQGVGGMQELYYISNFIKNKFGSGQTAQPTQSLGGFSQKQSLADFIKTNQ